MQRGDSQNDRLRNILSVSSPVGWLVPPSPTDKESVNPIQSPTDEERWILDEVTTETPDRERF